MEGLSRTYSPTAHLNPTNDRFIYTNGTHAMGLLREANIQGEIEEWLEAHHEGTVPHTKTQEQLDLIRARHFSTLGWNSETDKQLQLATLVWNAFRDDNPRLLESCMGSPMDTLPFLQDALARLFEEIPSATNGLTRTQTQMLQAVDQGISGPVEIFKFSQSQEDRIFMGDLAFYLIMSRLMEGTNPLFEATNDSRFQFPPHCGYTDDFKSQKIEITEFGKRVFARKADWLGSMPHPYWIGGIEIHGLRSWRWDMENERFTINR